jgi:hypothetical protein
MATRTRNLPLSPNILLQSRPLFLALLPPRVMTSWVQMVPVWKSVD